MLAGQPPFTGPTMESVLIQHLTVAAPRITDFQPDVPKPVAAALTRALAKAPAERFSGMAAFVEAIEASEAPTGAPPPAQLTSFIGRERETAAVQELLQSTRLLTLTGAGGSGKTRLALEVASRVGAQHPDGVAWVELAPLSNPELVPHHVADALGVRRDGIRSAGDALLEALRDWDALLVLDNCEHLVEACARLAEALLVGCPRLRIMATSREALGSGAERTLVRRLAVFAGGFTLDAAEAVAGGAGGAIAAVDVLDLLSGLVDKSLVALETEALEARYRMLETMRQFARERLDEAGEAAELGRRHALFFLARAEAAEPFLANQSEGWQERLAGALGNLRAAADWFERDRDSVEETLQFAAALHWFWFGLGHYREARRRLEAALERAGGARTRARGRALSSLAAYLVLQGERVELRPVAEESVAILREAAGASADLVCALVGLGQARLLAGDLEPAADVLAEALDLARAVRPRYWITYVLYWQGRVAQVRGDFAAARAAFDDGVTLALEDGFNQPIAHLATMRGRLALTEGDSDGALAWFAVALTPLKRMKNHWSTITMIEDLARIAT